MYLFERSGERFYLLSSISEEDYCFLSPFHHLPSEKSASSKMDLPSVQLFHRNHNHFIGVFDYIPISFYFNIQNKCILRSFSEHCRYNFVGVHYYLFRIRATRQITIPVIKSPIFLRVLQLTQLFHHHHTVLYGDSFQHIPVRSHLESK